MQSAAVLEDYNRFADHETTNQLVQKVTELEKEEEQEKTSNIFL